jgi:hypothetical protein
MDFDGSVRLECTGIDLSRSISGSKPRSSIAHSSKLASPVPTSWPENEERVTPATLSLEGPPCQTIVNDSFAPATAQQTETRAGTARDVRNRDGYA